MARPRLLFRVYNKRYIAVFADVKFVERKILTVCSPDHQVAQTRYDRGIAVAVCGFGGNGIEFRIIVNSEAYLGIFHRITFAVKNLHTYCVNRCVMVSDVDIRYAVGG